MVAGHEYVADVFGGNHVDRARYASPSRVGDAVIAFELPTASMQTAENYFPASHVEVVTIVASGWASAASVPYAISDRPTGMVVRTGSIPLTNGTGAGTVVGLGCGRYVLRFHQPDGRVSRVRFPVTDGGTCKT